MVDIAEKALLNFEGIDVDEVLVKFDLAFGFRDKVRPL
jgi:hypothetical protein